MRIYIASKTRHALLWRSYRQWGVNIISSWIDEAGEGQTRDFTDLWRRCVEEVKSADRLVLYVGAEQEGHLRGAFVEVGVALASGIEVHIVCDFAGASASYKRLRLGSWYHLHPLVAFSESLDLSFNYEKQS